MIPALCARFRSLGLGVNTRRTPYQARPILAAPLRRFSTLPDAFRTQKCRIEQTLRASGVLTSGQQLEDFLERNKLAGKGEQVFSIMDRATRFLAHAGTKFYPDSAAAERYHRQFLHHVSNFEIILGSPILTNAGRRDTKSVSSCSIPPVKLSSMTRSEIAKMVESYHTRGMGTGFCLDDVADPVEMVKQLNHIAVTEVQEGKIERSVGNMGVLSIDHPSVLAFIRIKQDNPQIKEWKFNLSVNFTDAFFAALKQGLSFTLKNGQLVDPWQIMRQVAESAHATGDPGLIFMDRINALNRTPQAGEYKTVVPCGEVSLFEGEVCQFSYLNLPRFIVGTEIDKDALRSAVHTLVHLLDNAVEANIERMPNEQSATIISSVRRIGIGVCGLAEVFQNLGLAYGSPEARELASDLMSFINFESKWASVALARDRGPFALFNHPQTRKELFIEPFARHPSRFVSTEDWQRLRTFFQACSIRNMATTILPPTGRSSLIAGVTGSIEPAFRLVADPVFKNALQRHCEGIDVDFDAVSEQVQKTGSVQETSLPPSVKDIFKTALEITPQEHVAMTAAVQKHIDEGISKTVNLPHDATVDDVAEVFLSAYDSGLKGITVYRDGSRTFQPKALNTNQDSMTIEDRIYGPVQVSARIATLLNSEPVSRLKKVHQNGTNYLVDPRQTTTRYEHSVGTLMLAQLLGGNESMQIAALLHDISHTAFSHVTDLVFFNSKQNYHDLIREKYLGSSEVQQVLQQCGIGPAELACETIPMVKGAGINVDRLDYAIRDLSTVNRIFQPEYSSIVNNLTVDADGAIICKDLSTARLIFAKFLEANLEIYFNPLNEVATLVMATILRAMLREGYLTEQDLLTYDDMVIEKILESPFRDIFLGIKPDMSFSISDTETKYYIARKLRYVNPRIIGMPGHLTDHCPESRKQLESYLSTPTKVYYHIPILGDLQ